jgi:fructoselysine-6-P-deglycase FrlB-like protein
MAIETILAQIDSEIARLTQARALLTSIGTSPTKGKVAKVVAAKAGKKRVLSADARKRIADAQRRRWAAQKAKAKSSK